MLKKFLLLCVFAAGYLFAAEYTVIVAPDAAPAEKTGGKELQRFLSRLSGKKVVLSESGKEVPGTYKLYVGQTPEIKKALKIKDFNSFKPDELRIFRKGNNFYFTGDRPRGSLYAVHTFLEDYCGMRFYAPDEITKRRKSLLW